MPQASRRDNFKRKSGSGHYAGIPDPVIESDSFRQLSGNAVRLLVLFAYQYRGSNNGDLSAPLSFTENWGIKSSATLARTLKELIDARLIIKTRDPTRDRSSPYGQCALYALTWQNIDECKGKHDCKPTRIPIRKFSLEGKQ
ncbi:hypothetical protein KO507_17030 [Gilvimarinus agarilyticus]|nr:hypothetical protein [Gilvimarinus agarilyticus]